MYTSITYICLQACAFAVVPLNSAYIFGYCHQLQYVARGVCVMSVCTACPKCETAANEHCLHTAHCEARTN